MKEKTAHFEQVKRHNRKLIRNTLRIQHPMRIAEIVEVTSLSYPTVSALLTELQESREVLINPETESCGGRPGMRYELNSLYQHALVMYFHDWKLKMNVYDSYGEKVWGNELDVSSDVRAKDIEHSVIQVKEKFFALSTVVLGVPGVVCNGVITFLPKFPKLEGEALNHNLENNHGLYTIIENDINAVALADSIRFQNFAHIAYVNECIGAGIVLNGDIVRGAMGYAGELEYLCEDLSNQEHSFAAGILALSCVLDLPDVLISGQNCKEATKEAVYQLLKKEMPEERIPTIHIADDMEERYKRGLLKLALLKWEEDD